MSRSSSQVRDRPRLTLADPTQSYEDMRSDLRKLSLPASPSPHVRKQSFDAQIRSTRSGISRDASPHAHSRVPSLQMLQQSLDSPGPATSRTITQSSYQSNSRPPSRGRLGPEDFPPPPPIGGSYTDRISSPTGSRTSSLSRTVPNSATLSRGSISLSLEDLLPPPPISGKFSDHLPSPTSSRASSRSRGGPDSAPLSSAPGSRTASPSRPQTPTTAKLNKKRTWLMGKSHGRSESASMRPEPTVFVVGTTEKYPYDMTAYHNRQQVHELWDEQGDLFVYLFGEAQPPSFRLKSYAIDHSRAFKRLLAARDKSRDSSASRASAQLRHASRGSIASIDSAKAEGHKHLYIPLQFSNATDLRHDDLENLVAVRNLFAFLIGQILVGTPKQDTVYAVFKNIAGLLSHYEFTNADGSTYGEVARQNFLGYVEDLRLDDLRQDKDKTLEAIVLGEMMKSWSLYNEGYVHAVGKWDEIYAMDNEKMKFITPLTRKRMEKSHMDLQNRLHAAQLRLNDFDFPSLFQGIAASSGFQKAIDVKSWRAAWVSMRRFTMTHYKQRYGAWPPKASSKKNDFEESGLNRIVLQELYKDFADLYDMLVDKSNLTTRSADMAAHDVRLADNPHLHWLRQLMSEFDRSSPPIKPPILYDLCLLPDLKLVRRDYDSLPEKKQAKERTRKLKTDDISLVLMQSYDRDMMRATPFLQAFMAYERHACQNKTIDEMVDIRIGQWMFLYVVLQSLPLLVVDAPEVRHTEGVEYFLCEVPKGTPPWLREETVERRLQQGADITKTTNVPAGNIQNSVEGIYERSHCWQMAKIWSNGLAKMPGQAISVRKSSLQPETSFLEDLPPPPLVGQSWRSVSQNSSPRGSVSVGMEDLPLPPPLRTNPGGHSRKASTPDVTKTFDDILGSTQTPTLPKKKTWGSFSGQ